MRKQQRTAVIDIGHGEALTLKPLSPADMAALQRKHTALFDAVTGGEDNLGLPFILDEGVVEAIRLGIGRASVYRVLA